MPQSLSPFEILDALFGVFGFVFSWWWLWLPIILIKPAIKLWLWWRKDIWNTKQVYTILEIRIPSTGDKPFMAMESVFSGLWQAIHDPPDTPEKWIEGKYQATLAIEIVSVESDIHFYLMFQREYRNAIETAI